MNLTYFQAFNIREIILCLIGGVGKGEKYPPGVRMFAFNLNYHSPRAYEFVRSVFNNNLPNESTIRGWYENSDLNCTPGINKNMFDVIKRKSDEAKKSGKEFVCNLLFDEMNIRKHIQWRHSSKQMLGFTTYGEDKLNKSIANQALVFMISDINSSFICPVAYHFITSLNAQKKKDLVWEVIVTLYNIGVEISSITFDGFAANPKMCNLLGANLDVYDPNFKTTFDGPDGKPIYIFYDPSHMIKLVRNQFARKNILFGRQNDKIQWSYLQHLVNFKNNNNLSMTHKLNAKHMQWSRKIMKVNIAVQTLSNSTASSINFLMKKKYPEFASAEETIYFIELFNDLFDVFNTKHDEKKNIYKNPLNHSNKNAVFELFNRAEDYIKNIKFSKKNGAKVNICSTRSKTGFVGFIVNMHSLKDMFSELVETKEILTSIPTQRISQDHLEQRFCQIRSLNGFNDNPTQEQFTSAFRKTFAFNIIFISSGTTFHEMHISNNNVSNILTVPKSHKRTDELQNMDNNSDGGITGVTLEEINQLNEKLIDLENVAEDSADNLQKYSIGQNAYSLESKIRNLITSQNQQKKFHCTSCSNVFDENTKHNDVYENAKSPGKPCSSTVKICEIADRFLKLELLNGNIKFETIHYAICAAIDVNSLYPASKFECDENHKLYLIRYLIDEYINIRCTYIAHKASLDIHDKFLRNQFHKLVHNRGQ